MARITTRAATPDDIGEIEGLIAGSPHAPYAEGMDMTGAENYWLLAVKGEDVFGGILLALGRPYGFMDFLCVKESVSDVDRGRTVSALVNDGAEIIRQSGASFVVSAIPHSLKSYRRVAKRRGYRTAASGALVYRRVA